VALCAVRWEDWLRLRATRRAARGARRKRKKQEARSKKQEAQEARSKEHKMLRAGSWLRTTKEGGARGDVGRDANARTCADV
jgi:hypothetical protein